MLGESPGRWPGDDAPGCVIRRPGMGDWKKGTGPMGERPYGRMESWGTLIGRWLGMVELRVLVPVVLVVGGIWLFVVIADAVVMEEPGRLDTALLLALREPTDARDPIGPEWFEEMVRDFTSFGSTGPLLFLTFAVAGYFVLHRDYHMAALVVVTVLGAFALTLLLKLGFDRPRPELVPRVTYVATASFPSGHAGISAATYLTLGALVARLQPRRRLKGFVMAVAMLLAFLVGFSRVYLGVHWPSDVLAGWTIGAVWAMVALLLSRWWRKRGRVQLEREVA
jgi:undecaprenyl-diphosphatase